MNTCFAEPLVVVKPLDLPAEYIPTPRKQIIPTVPPATREYDPISFQIDPVIVPPLRDISPTPKAAIVKEIEDTNEVHDIIITKSLQYGDL